jgi:tRNA(adenine34) deaminase
MNATGACGRKATQPMTRESRRPFMTQPPSPHSLQAPDLPVAVDDYWMSIALDEANLAASQGEIPVGCAIVDRDGRLVARAHNARESLADPTAHAEIVAIREAAARVLSWRLDGAVAYVTLEPCAMCAGALVHARVRRLVYGCADPKGGAVDTMFGIGRDARLNHRFEVLANVRQDECAERLRSFFGALRK